jgi:hypothetical protein
MKERPTILSDCKFWRSSYNLPVYLSILYHKFILQLAKPRKRIPTYIHGCVTACKTENIEENKIIKFLPAHTHTWTPQRERILKLFIPE